VIQLRVREEVNKQKHHCENLQTRCVVTAGNIALYWYVLTMFLNLMHMLSTYIYIYLHQYIDMRKLTFDYNKGKAILQDFNKASVDNSASGRIMSMKNYNDTIGKGTRDLLACSL
jgi:hypothetical protein